MTRQHTFLISCEVPGPSDSFLFVCLFSNQLPYVSHFGANGKKHVIKFRLIEIANVLEVVIVMLTCKFISFILQTHVS